MSLEHGDVPPTGRSHFESWRLSYISFYNADIRAVTKDLSPNSEDRKVEISLELNVGKRAS